jgi:anti-sigma factor RsiW
MVDGKDFPSMKCNDCRENLDLYLDTELIEPERSELEVHVASCDACRTRLERRRETRRKLRAVAYEHRLKPEFHSRIRAKMVAESASRRRARSARVKPSIVISASVCVVALTAGGAWLTGAMGGGQLKDDASGQVQSVNVMQGKVAGVSDIRLPVVAQSIRWYRRQVPVEVTGPNALVVQEWFATKVDFPIRVPDFDRSVNLLGGRLGHVEQSVAAVLVYEVDGSKLSVLVFDASEIVALGRGSGSGSEHVYIDNSEGYTVAVSERDGVGYTFTSTLPEARMLELVSAAFAR